MRPTRTELFTGFMLLGLNAFGGALPWARRALVERRRWLTPAEFLDTLSLCHFMPGGNILNVGVVVGARSHGWTGSVAAAAGFLGVPLLIFLGIGMFYAATGEIAWLRGGLAGMAAAAAGMLVATAIKLALPLLRARPFRAGAVLALTFGAVAIVGVPLAWVLLALAPVSIALARPR